MTRRPRHSPCRPAPARAAGAFTIAELLVIVVIMALVLTIAVPAFSAMVYSSERALADNTLRSGVSAARDLAARSDRGGDGAVAFVFEPDGRLGMIPVVQVGTIEDADGQSLNRTVRRDVFAPTFGAEVVQLPRLWMVRGHAPAESFRSGWYTSNEAYGTSAARDEANWVFPETGFYDRARQVPTTGGAISAGAARQSFIVRFDAGTGASYRGGGTALVVDPRPSSEGRANFQNWERADRAENLERWASNILSRPAIPSGVPNQASENRRRQLIGNQSHDTILAQDVTRLALYDERRLASGIGARGVNASTSSIYAPFQQGQPSPRFDAALFNNPANVRERINRWINLGQRYSEQGQPLLDSDLEPEARIFSVQPYSGGLTEILR